MIVGHQKQWQFLKQAATLERLSHAYLFAGPSKLGKKTIALKWLSLILNYPLEEKQHPDFILIEPRKKTIQISQIRELIWKLSLKASLSTWKTAIIDQAHLMGAAAQHALLKSLEEPKGKAILILISEKRESLFPTILSRCETIKFYPVRKSEIQKFLQKKGLSLKEAEKIATISEGKPGSAIDFLSDPEKIKRREKIIEELIEISKSPLILRFKYAKTLSQEESLRDILDIWLSYLREALLTKVQGSSSFGEYSSSELKNILSELQKTILLISTTNVNSRLALDTLMLKFDG